MLDPERLGGTDGKPAHLTFILWDGTLGGAETLSVELARKAGELGHDATVAFIKGGNPLVNRAREYSVPTVSLGLTRGRDLLRGSQRYAAVIGATNPDLVITMSVNHLAWCLRRGGYRGRLVAVEHGELLRHEDDDRLRRHLRRIDRLIASRLIDAEVAVSAFIAAQALGVPHAARLITIPNGVDTERFRAGVAEIPAKPTVFGFAGRLIPGKGVDLLIEAVGRITPRADIKLRIAGDGPERSNLEARAAATPAPGSIEFLGNVTDMPAFWRSVHVGVAPSSTIVESFGLSSLEAMASQRPVVVTRNGGLAELVCDGVTGSVVEANDSMALEGALVQYLDEATIVKRGRSARDVAVDKFSLDACFAEYLKLARGSHHPARRSTA